MVVTDLRSFTFILNCKDNEAIAATCFQPLSTCGDASSRKRLVLLYKDGVTLGWSNENSADTLEPDVIRGHTLIGQLFVSRLQKVFFFGVMGKRLSLFRLDAFTSKIDLVFSDLSPFCLDTSSLPLIEEFDDHHFVFCQQSGVRFLNVTTHTVVDCFLLQFSPASVHVFGNCVVSFFDEERNTLHSYAVVLGGTITPISSRILCSNFDQHTQLVTQGSSALFLWNGTKRNFSSFDVVLDKMEHRIEEKSIVPIADVSSLKSLCQQAIMKHKNRFTVNRKQTFEHSGYGRLSFIMRDDIVKQHIQEPAPDVTPLSTFSMDQMNQSLLDPRVLDEYTKYLLAREPSDIPDLDDDQEVDHDEDDFFSPSTDCSDDSNDTPKASSSTSQASSSSSSEDVVSDNEFFSLVFDTETEMCSVITGGQSPVEIVDSNVFMANMCRELEASTTYWKPRTFTPEQLAKALHRQLVPQKCRRRVQRGSLFGFA